MSATNDSMFDFLERRGVIVLLAFIAILILAWAISANGRYQFHRSNCLILDTRTGEVSHCSDAPKIWKN